MDNAASTAPPPGTTKRDSTVRLRADKASWTDRSISSSMKELAPRRMIEAVEEFLHPCYFLD